MVFGHNSNIKLGANTLHVQTEDRGGTNCMIDTTVYYLGRVLHRRTNNYHDLLPLTEDNQQALKLRVDEQHRTVLDAIRSVSLVDELVEKHNGHFTYELDLEVIAYGRNYTGKKVGPYLRLFAYGPGESRFIEEKRHALDAAAPA